MKLRKLTMVVFLTEHSGGLRLYTDGREVITGIVDVVPRIGRAVLFKSEQMLHKPISSQGQDDYALTFYFN